MGWLTALVWATGLGLLWWRVEPLLGRWFAYLDQRRLLDEAINLREDIAKRETREQARTMKAADMALAKARLDFEMAHAADEIAFKKHQLEVEHERLEAEAKRNERPKVTESEAMPTDLRLYIAEQSEPWAKEQLLQKAGELYAEHKNWDAVRIGIGAG